MDKKTDIQRFLSTHQLPSSYQYTAQQWFEPLCERVLQHQHDSSKPFIISITGCQGSGKTTLSSFIDTYLTSVQGKTVVSLSIDDFYLDQTARLALANTIHPLLKTRGVPGTHDIELALRTFNQLQNGTPTQLPRFDKSTDNPYSVNEWPVINTVPDFIILEGWCVGVKPEPEAALQHPINNLEKTDDPQGIWRSFVNTQLADDYQALFNMIDYQIMLKAPSFDCVFNWRLEQEHKLKKAAASHNDKHQLAIMTEAQIATFIQHYQRLTEHALKTLPEKSDTVFFLDEARTITHQKVSK